MKQLSLAFLMASAFVASSLSAAPSVVGGPLLFADAHEIIGGEHHHHHHHDHDHDDGVTIDSSSSTEGSSSSSASAPLPPSFRHKCIHDSPLIQDAMRRDMHIVEQKYESFDRRLSPQATMSGKIRFVISSEDLNEGATNKYCTSVGQSGISNFLGQTVLRACTEEDILTSEKRTILLTKILPAATRLLSEAILVNPVIGNLAIASGCSAMTTPSSHISSGVPNADFALYVAAGPTELGTVAWASSCASDASGRPVAGKANFSPIYIRWPEGDTKTQNMLVRTAAHELLHALGFSAGAWSTVETIQGLTMRGSEVRRGAARSIATAPGAVGAAQSFFGCDTLTGPEIEDEGGSGTAGSHWDRRTHFDDIMSGLVGDQMYLSAVTLAMMADLGYYSFDPAKAESPVWLRGGGCGVHDSKCNTAAGGLGRYFCNPLTVTEPTCNYDFSAVGSCGLKTYIDAIPAEEQYFSDPAQGGTPELMNHCPMVSTLINRQCDSAANAEPSNNDTGNYYAPDGKCFTTTRDVAIIGKSFSGLGTGRCLRRRCVPTASGYLGDANPSTAQYVEVTIGASDWVRCTAIGQVISLAPYGYAGSLTCPDPATHCPPLVVINVTTTASTTIAPAPANTTTAVTEQFPEWTSPTTTTAVTTAAPAVVLPTGVPRTARPSYLKPANPVSYFLYLTLVGPMVTRLITDGDTNNTFKEAVAADIAVTIGLTTNTSATVNPPAEGQVLVDRHVPAVGRRRNAATGQTWEEEALDLRILIAGPTRPTGFILSMWTYTLNASGPFEEATWMKNTRRYMRESVLNITDDGDGEAAPSGAASNSSSARGFAPMASTASSSFTFSVQDIFLSDPIKSSDFMAECGTLGCVGAVAVATIGGWAGVVLAVVAIYHLCLFYKKKRLREEAEAAREAEQQQHDGAHRLAYGCEDDASYHYGGAVPSGKQQPAAAREEDDGYQHQVANSNSSSPQQQHQHGAPDDEEDDGDADEDGAYHYEDDSPAAPGKSGKRRRRSAARKQQPPAATTPTKPVWRF